MNSIKYFLFFYCALISLSSCNNTEGNKKGLPKDNTSWITGQVFNFIDTPLVFSYYPYGFLETLQTKIVQFDNNGNFNVKFNLSNPIKGWFSFGKVPITEEFTYKTIHGNDTIAKTGTFDFRMVYVYLEPGDSLNLKVDIENINKSLSFSGEGVDNNKFVNAEEGLFNSYKNKFLNNYYDLTKRKPDDYKNIIDLNLEKKLAFLESYKDTSELSSFLVDHYKTNYYANAIGAKINYPKLHSSYNNNSEVNLPDDYYDFLDKVKLEGEISKYGIGYFYNLKAYLQKKFEITSENTKKEMDFYEWTSTELPDTSRYQFMAYSLGSDFSRRLYDEFGANSPFPEISKVVKEKYSHLEGMLEGSLAPNVTFRDINNESVSLAQFQGKYTYIDLWATWCGPCIKEMPSLKKLEEMYGDKDVYFVSVSVNDKKDIDIWKEFIKDNNLTGIQLISSKETYDTLSTAFNIKMIPRFVLLDRDGAIVDATAPFPSDPELIKLFEKCGIRLK